MNSPLPNALDSASPNAILKREIRRRQRTHRASLDAEFRNEANRQIAQRLSELWQNYSSKLTRDDIVALYLATEFEASVDEFAAWILSRGVNVAAPVQCAPTTECRIELRVLSAASTFAASTFNVRLGPRGVREPCETAEVVAPQEIDLWVLPGLAFDVAGNRLGYGGGWFDRALAQRSPESLLVGVCFEAQIEENLPREAHDVPVHFIVTEARTLKI